MESVDDMVVVIVGDVDGQNESSDLLPPFEVKQEILDEGELDEKVEELMKLAEKYGEYLTCDTYEYEESEIKKEKLGFDDSYVLDGDEYDEYMEPQNGEDDEDAMHSYSEIERFNPRKQIPGKSFVEELRNKYPELRRNKDKLVKNLVKIMKSVKRPPPPRDYYIVNSLMFQCVKCGVQTETEPAAWRHYQDKHGPRYLVCYACGVDFRSTTNLYKHEKICSAADAVIVLQARAIFLGRKGRGRPLVQIVEKEIKKSYAKKSFPCTECPAVFNSKYNLQSHEHLHRGERPYRCHVCPRAYTSYSALKRHVQTHTDVQYMCDHCGRTFKVKGALIVHMDTHLPQRKYACSLCERRYLQKAALKLHINRVHLNLPPPCACQICPKRYPRMSVLKQHMKKAHGLSIMTRNMFFKALPTLTDSQMLQFHSIDLTTEAVSQDQIQ